ncbi:MAG: response regulator [bacterium]
MARILVIDDEEVVRDVLRRILESHGYEVAAIEDGRYAMQTVSRETPDLIILDVMMPDLDGMALAYHLKFESDYRKIPILMLTSLTDAHTRQYSRESAVDCFMTKPFEEAELLERVSGLLKNKAVRVGAKRKLLERRHFYSINLLLIAALAAFIAVFLVNVYAPPAPPDAGASPGVVSFFADRLFILVVPVVLIVILYQTYLLHRIYHEKNRR